MSFTVSLEKKIKLNDVGSICVVLKSSCEFITNSYPDYRVSFSGDILNPPRCLPVQPAVGNPLQQGVGHDDPQRSLPTLRILRFINLSKLPSSGKETDFAMEP